MRNIQNDDVKLSYSNLFAINKNSQADVIEEGNKCNDRNRNLKLR